LRLIVGVGIVAVVGLTPSLTILFLLFRGLVVNPVVEGVGVVVVLYVGASVGVGVAVVAVVRLTGSLSTLSHASSPFSGAWSRTVKGTSSLDPFTPLPASFPLRFPPIKILINYTRAKRRINPR